MKIISQVNAYFLRLRSILRSPHAIGRCQFGPMVDPARSIECTRQCPAEPGRMSCFGIDARGADQTRKVSPVGVSVGIEFRHVPPHRLALHDIVDAGEKAVGGSSNAGQGFDIRIRLELQAPVASSAPGTAKHSLARSALLEQVIGRIGRCPSLTRWSSPRMPPRCGIPCRTPPLSGGSRGPIRGTCPRSAAPRAESSPRPRAPTPRP